MKKHFRYGTCFLFSRYCCVFFLIGAFVICSCSSRKWTVPPELAGQWKSAVTKITVRTEPRWMKFEFTSDIALVTLTVNNDKSVSGSVGSAEFKNGKIKKNGGNPDRTGVAWIIQCGSVGKIFPSDPLEHKEVEIWLGPIKGDMHAELRYTEGGAMFPMADLMFRKVRVDPQ